jgi:uncharacterized phage-associated protein
MATGCTFDLQKSIETILYVSQRQANLYRLLKILYFADKEHLAQYGRTICGDSYVAMRLGPVPSGAYDVIKCARGDGTFLYDESILEAIEVRNRTTVVALRDADVEFLSESDRECLDRAIEQYGRMSFARLKKLGHDDAAYQAADDGDFIPLEEIAKTLPDRELLLEHLIDA